MIKNNNSISFKHLFHSLIWLIKTRSKKKSYVLILIIRIFLFSITIKIINKIFRYGPRNKILILCENIYYSGNSRAIFNHINTHHTEFECYWIANNFMTYKMLKKQNAKVLMNYSLIGIPFFLTANVWFRSHTGFGTHSVIPDKNFLSIQLWHGAGAAKGINHSKEDFDFYDAWCIPSDYLKKRYIELYGAPSEKLFVTGFPRMDSLHKYLQMEKRILLEELNIQNGKNIVLYAPTYNVGLWPWGNPYEEFEGLCQFCDENNLILILRLHPYAEVSRLKIKKIIQRYSNVYWRDMKYEPDTMKLLAITDILITSWSSISTDFLFLKKPIINLQGNIKYFTQTRGKPKLPPEKRAGVNIYNNNELYKELKETYINKNILKEKYETLLKIIHGNVDGKSSERVVCVMKNLLKKR